MKQERNRVGTKFLIFPIIVVLLFWLLPANLIMGEDSAGQSSDTTVVENTAETTVDTTAVEQTVETTTTDSSQQEQVYYASLDVVAVPEVVAPGENTTFKVVVKNTGNASLADITVSYKLPDLVVFTPVEGLTFNQETGEVSFIISSLNPGEESSKDIIAGIPAVINDSTQLTNLFKMSANNIEAVEKSVVLSVEKPAEEITADATTTNTTATTTNTYSPSISSDKDDYHPGEEVIITGEGFVPNEPIQLIFYAITTDFPDGKIEHIGTISNIGEDGKFIYKYVILGADKYRVEAWSIVENNSGQTEVISSDSVEINVDKDPLYDIVLGSLLAFTSFTDPSYGYTLEGQKADGSWTPGNLGKGWKAGDNVPIEFTISGLAAGTSYTVEVGHDYQDTINNSIGYSNFNTLTGISGTSSSPSPYFDAPSIVTQTGHTEKHYVLHFKTRSSSFNGTVVLSWYGRLGNDAYLWKGSTIDFRCEGGIGGDSTGQRTITINTNYLAPATVKVEKICTDSPTQSFDFTLTKTSTQGDSFTGLTSLQNGQNHIWSNIPSKSGSGYSYQLVETAVSGFNTTYQVYDIDGNPISIGSGSGTTVNFSISNTDSYYRVVFTNVQIKTGSIHVKKFGLDTGDTVIFTLTGQTNSAAVGNNSEVGWSSLVYGQAYTLGETGLASKYDTSAIQWVVYDNSGYTGTPVSSGTGTIPALTIGETGSNHLNYWVKVTNVKKTGSIHVKKFGLDTGDTVIFTLTGQTNSAAVGNNSEVGWSSLVYGQAYTLGETGLASKYDTSAIQWVVYDNSGYTGTPVSSGTGTIPALTIGETGSNHLNYWVKVTNVKKTGSIHVKKFGLDTGDTVIFTLTGQTNSAAVGNNSEVGWSSLVYGQAYTLGETGLASKYDTSAIQWVVYDNSGYTGTPVSSGTGTIPALTIGETGSNHLNYWVKVTNVKKTGSIHVKKFGLDTGDTVIFTLTGQTNSAAVGNNSEVGWSSLVYGQAYTLGETGLASKYDTSAIQWVVYDNSGYTGTPVSSGTGTIPALTIGETGSNHLNYWVKVTNVKKTGSIHVKKFGLDTGDTVIFTLTGQTNSAAVGNNSEVGWSSLVYGQAYTLGETGLASKYDTSAIQWVVYDNSGYTGTPVSSGTGTIPALTIGETGSNHLNYWVKVTNVKKTGSIHVKKFGLDTGDTVIFTLTGQTNSAAVGNNSEVGWSSLVYGQAYTLGETGLASKYDTSAIQWVVYDNSGYTGTPVSSGTGTIPALTIGETGSNHLNYWVKVTNVKKTGSIHVKKFGLDTGDTVIFTLTGQTNSAAVGNNSEVGWSSLVYGQAYTLGENIDSNYELVSYKVYSNSDYTGLITSGTGTLPSLTIGDTGDNHLDYYVKVTNQRKPGTLNLIKYIDGSMPAKDSINSTFTIHWSAADGSSGDIKLDKNNGWSESGFNLKSGLDYTFEELANSSYGFVKIIDNNKKEYTNPKFTLTAIPGDNGIISFYNETGSITVHKTSSTDSSINVADAIYGLFISDGASGYIQAKDANGNPVSNQTTNTGGIAVFSNLITGTYFVKEINAPSNYYLDDVYHQAIIPLNGLFKIIIDVSNVPIPPPTPTPTPTPPPTPTGTVAVAALTTGTLQVLAFTGIDPIIPISGGSAVIAGLAILLATLRRRVNRK